MATTPQLPNPATAKSPTTTLNGVTYYLRTGAGATPTWLRVGTGNKLYPVDLTGKQVAGKPAVFNTEAEWAKSVNTAIQPKPTAASTGSTVGSSAAADNAKLAAALSQTIKPAPAPAPTAGKPAPTAGVEQFGGVTPPSRLNLPDPTTALSKIITNASDAPPTMKTDSTTGTSFYLAPPTGNAPAMWVAVPKGSSVASNGQSLQALQRAQTDYINPKQTTPAEAQAQARQAVIDQQQAAAQQPVTPVAPAGGGTTKGVAQAQPVAPSQPTQPTAPAVPMLTGTALIQKQTEFTNRLRDAQTQDEFDTIVSQAAAAGAPLNQGIVDSFQKTFAQRFQQAQTQQQAQLAQQYQTQLSQAKTQAEFDKIVADAKAAGATINQGLIDQYQTAITQRTQQAEQQRIDVLRGQFQARLPEVKTQADLDKLVAEAKTAGVTLDTGIVDRTQQVLTQQAQAAEQQRIAQLSQQYQAQLGQAQTQEQFDAIVTQARDAGAPVNEGFVNQFQTILSQNLQRQAEQQAAAEQARVQSEQIGLTLPAPGTEQFGYYVSNQFDITTPDGTMYRATPQNITTGEPGGWYQSKDSGTTWTSWQDGQAQGPAIPRQQFEQQIQTVGQNNATFIQAQEAAAREQSSLQNLAGQQRYSAAYQQLASSGQPFTSQDVIRLGNQQAEQAFRADQASSEALRAESRERAQQQANPDYGPFDDLLYATLAVVAIGAIAGSMGGSLGSLGGTAGAEASAVAGEAATTAGTMAQSGATASEIAGVLEGTYGMSSAAAAEVAGTATGALSGAIPAETLATTLASSGVTPEMIAIANATADPIAALTAQAGWTAVDMSYLASIGMPASVMTAAAATNAALGMPTTVAEWAAATGTEVAGGAGVGGGTTTGPVAPGTAAVDTSQMIPAYDAAGNVGYFDPATGNFYSESGQLISEGTSAVGGGGGTQYAGVDSGAVTDIGGGAATGGGPGETVTQIFDDGSQLIMDSAGNPIGGLDSAGNPFSVNPETGAGFYPETGLPTAGAGGGGGGAGGAGAGAEAGTTTTAPSTPSTPPPTGETTTQIFDDGSKLVLDSNGNVVSGVDSIGNTFTVDPATGIGKYDAIGTPLSDPSNVPIIDKSVPYVPGNEPTLMEGLKNLGGAVIESLPSVGVKDVLAAVGAANILGPMLVPPPPTVEQPSYGPLPPLTYGRVGQVNLPGLNPGAILPVPADYQTTSPVQSKFYYGPRPYQPGTTFDPTLYAQVNKPAQPYGLQQAFFETPQSYDQYQFRPYAPDLTRVDPLATTYQPTLPVVPQTQG